MRYTAATLLQQCLKTRGWYHGKVDGIAGPLTKSAVSLASGDLAAYQLMLHPETKQLLPHVALYELSCIVSKHDCPPWLRCAIYMLGTQEIPGARHNSAILDLWIKIGIKIRDDETPWCATFVGAMLKNAGYEWMVSAAARSYLKYGIQSRSPHLGAIAVLWRGSRWSWKGHVGFVVGRCDNRLVLLGGNQGDTVSLMAVDFDRVLSYRWPAGHFYWHDLGQIDNKLLINSASEA